VSRGVAYVGSLCTDWGRVGIVRPATHMASVLDCLLRCTLAGVHLTRTLWTGLSCDVLGGLIWPSRNGRRRARKPARAARKPIPARGKVRGAGFEPALLAWQANVTTMLYYPRAFGRQA